MKNFFEKINRNSLLAGIIGTILFIYFLQPILEFVGNSIVIFYKSISQSLYNRVFEEMAFGKPDYDFIIILLFNGIVLSFALGAFIATVIPRKIKKEEIKGKKKKQQGEKNEAKNRKNLTLRKVFYGVFFLSTLFFISLSYIKHTYIQSFEQKIRIITPYINTLNKDMLISNFSRMKNYDDYQKIINEIEKIEEKNNIELPNTTTHWF
ncbi:hypothetical protein [Zunongwangia endophytica]|uniref:Uncharacterized protein n=1 Tax=Zunongwangia endophytica TaxID=1808945 RepID=A0ABV8HBU0_9FLAO|nr:hypothetical protein [Zunongwangia endophytica]MDN3593275.1 hypothetical protein [Zunongwangia endophytica]MDN3594224.1 hypothetical protein [Zunongwangia endophytica]